MEPSKYLGDLISNFKERVEKLTDIKPRAQKKSRAKKKPKWHEKNLPFYILIFILTMIVSGIYVLNQPDGENYPWIGLPLDDSWIHLDYARSLAEQGRFHYNPGIPEAGMSSPLWAIVLAIGYKLFIPLGITPQWIAKGASLLFALALPIAAYHLMRQLVAEREWAWITGILVALDPNLAYGAVSGMEVTLTTFLILSAIWLSLRKAYLLTGLTLGALVITRGEGVPIALVIGGIPLLFQYFKRKAGVLVLITREEFSMGLKLFLPALITGIFWAMFNYSVNGNFLPNTYYVKHGFDLGFFNLQNLSALFTGYVLNLGYFKGIMFVFAIIGISAASIYLFRAKHYHFLGLLLGIPLSQFYLFSINLHLWPDGPWIYYARRYMDFLIPFWVILLLLGFRFIWQRTKEMSNNTLSRLLPLVTMALIGLFFFGTVNLHIRFVNDFYVDTKRVETVDAAIGKWVANNLPNNASIGITEAGAVRYFTLPEQTIIDFLGLNCHFCVGQPPDYIINQLQPDYLVFFRPAIPDEFQFEEIYVMDTYPDGRGSELVVLKLLD